MAFIVTLSMGHIIFLRLLFQSQVRQIVVAEITEAKNGIFHDFFIWKLTITEGTGVQRPSDL